jgi:hypothetical protein
VHGLATKHGGASVSPCDAVMRLGASIALRPEESPFAYSWQIGSEAAVVAHFVRRIAAAAAIANTINAVQSKPRQSLRGDALESSERFDAGAVKPTTRDS